MMNVRGVSRHRWLARLSLVAMSLLYFLLMAGTFNSLGLILPAMVQDFGMNWTEAGFGFTLLGTACGIISLLPAHLIRRIGVSGTLALGTAILFAGFLLMYVSQGVASYYVGATLLGIGFCFCGTVPGVHVLSTAFQRRSTVIGVYFTIGSLGAVAGPAFYWLSQHLGLSWRSYWLAFAAGSLLTGLFAVLVARASSAAEPVKASVQPVTMSRAGDWRVRPALGTAQFWIIVLAYTACLAINTTTHSFSYQHLLENGASAGRATQLISYSAFLGALGSALAGALGEHVSPRKLTVLSLACLALSSATLAVGRNDVVLAIWVMSLGVGLGFSYVGTAMMMQEYFGRRASLELYSIMTAISTSAALGPALGGRVRDATGNFAGIFYVLAAIAIVLLIAVLALRKPVAAYGSAGHFPPADNDEGAERGVRQLPQV